MGVEIRVKCSLCGGSQQEDPELGPCPRCKDGTQELKNWFVCRGTKPPVIECLPSGYVRLSFSHERWAQFPVSYRGVLSDSCIFHADWNREFFSSFCITNVEVTP